MKGFWSVTLYTQWSFFAHIEDVDFSMLVFEREDIHVELAVPFFKQLFGVGWKVEKWQRSKRSEDLELAARALEALVFQKQPYFRKEIEKLIAIVLQAMDSMEESFINVIALCNAMFPFETEIEQRIETRVAVLFAKQLLKQELKEEAARVLEYSEYTCSKQLRLEKAELYKQLGMVSKWWMEMRMACRFYPVGSVLEQAGEWLSPFSSEAEPIILHLFAVALDGDSYALNGLLRAKWVPNFNFLTSAADSRSVLAVYFVTKTLRTRPCKEWYQVVLANEAMIEEDEFACNYPMVKVELFTWLEEYYDTTGQDLQKAQYYREQLAQLTRV